MATHPHGAFLWCHTLSPRRSLKSHINLICIARGLSAGENWRKTHQKNTQTLHRTGLNLENSPEFFSKGVTVLTAATKPKRVWCSDAVWIDHAQSLLYLKGCYSIHQNPFCVQVKQKYPKPLSSVFQVAQYLLDLSFVLDEESMYEASLRIEPKVPNWWGIGPPNYLHC